MLVKLKHGTCNYQGTRHTVGAEFEVTELFYKTNSTRFEKVEVVDTVNIQNVVPESNESVPYTSKKKRNNKSSNASVSQ